MINLDVCIDAPEGGVDSDDGADSDPSYANRRADADPAGLRELEDGVVLAEARAELEAAEPGEGEGEQGGTGDHEEADAALPDAALAEAVVAEGLEGAAPEGAGHIDERVGGGVWRRVPGGGEDHAAVAANGSESEGVGARIEEEMNGGGRTRHLGVVAAAIIKFVVGIQQGTRRGKQVYLSLLSCGGATRKKVLRPPARRNEPNRSKADQVRSGTQVRW